MQPQKHKFPVGIQDFVGIREEGYLYVDKTDLIYKLVTEGKPYFLGRPRRFGKSLLISTLKAYFSGQRELFGAMPNGGQELAIYALEKEWKKYPVIHIDFAGGNYNNLDGFKSGLNMNLRKYETEWGVNSEGKDFADRFAEIIESANRQTDEKVVILIDEYDKPLLQTLENGKPNEEIKNALKAFYGTLKREDAYLKFYLLTGITKFSKVSVFSDLNQLLDISMDEKYATICGITQSELETIFEEDIKNLGTRRKMSYNETLAKLSENYNGYCFYPNTESVYNPFSLLNTFFSGDFKYYWFATGTPTFLVKEIERVGLDVKNLNDKIELSIDGVQDYRQGEDSVESLLYQSGYLTIKDYDIRDRMLTLGYPNEEVRFGMLRELLLYFVPKTASAIEFSVLNFVKSLRNNDYEKFFVLLESFFASVPYDIAVKKDEAYFQMLFYLLFSLMGQYVEAEEKSSLGSADAVVKTDGNIFIFEFKVEKGGCGELQGVEKKSLADVALRQIEDKHYGDKYLADGREIVKIGVVFSVEKRNIAEWKVLD